jgi:hypothetical protein
MLESGLLSHFITLSPVIARARRGTPPEGGGQHESSSPTKFLRDAICNEAVEMQTRFHFLRTYETYPGIIYSGETDR